MQQHDPRIRIHVAPPRNRHQVGEEIASADQLTDGGLKLERTEPTRAGLEENGTRLLEIDDPPGVVREHVPRIVVRRREREPADAAAVLNVVGDLIEPFVEQVGGEREQRGPRPTL